MEAPITPSISEALARVATPSLCATKGIHSTNIVGAHRDKDGALSDRDEAHMKRVLEVCAEAGIKVSAQMQLASQNIIYNENYLSAPQSAHAIVYGMVNYDPTFSSGSSIDRRFYTQCMNTGQKGVWYNAQKGTGARVVFNIHRNDIELPTSKLIGSEYALAGTYKRDGFTIDVIKHINFAHA